MRDITPAAARALLQRVLSYGRARVRQSSERGAKMALLYLIDELLVLSFKGIDVADDLVRLSMSCKKLAALTSSSRVLWLNIVFSSAGSGRITDSQLAAFLKRVDARSCTALLRLQYCKISGVGLLPLQGSEVLQFLDLRQAHGPSAHYPDQRKYWDGEALLKLLESLQLSKPADGHGTSSLLACGSRVFATTAHAADARSSLPAQVSTSLCHCR